MGKKYDNLISTTAGFKYNAQQPLDDREVVQSYTDLAALVSSNTSYEGMRVYVIDDKKSYELTADGWKAVASEDYVDQKVTDLSASKQDNLAFDGEYNAETNKVATVKTVTDKIADVIAGADTSFDTLKEIADWINTHPESVAQINALIQANADKIAKNETAIANLNTLVQALSDSTSESFTSVNADIETLEGNITALENSLVKDVSASVEGQVLTVEVKDKDGKVIATTNVTLPSTDLTECVKFTDYPTTDPRKAGVINIDNYYGFKIGTAGSEGCLLPLFPGTTEMKERATYRFINPQRFDAMLKCALTDSKYTLTDEEKEIICGWLGAATATTTNTTLYKHTLTYDGALVAHIIAKFSETIGFAADLRDVSGIVDIWDDQLNTIKIIVDPNEACQFKRVYLDADGSIKISTIGYYTIYDEVTVL